MGSESKRNYQKVVFECGGGAPPPFVPPKNNLSSSDMLKRKRLANRRANEENCHASEVAPEEEIKKSTHMPAWVRQVFYDEFSAALAGGEAYAIPHNIDVDGNMYKTTPPTVLNLQTKLSAGGDIACAEYGFLDVRDVVGGGVMVYNSEYLSKYQHERQRAPQQNGLATYLFGDLMKGEIFGTVIITNYKDFY